MKRLDETDIVSLHENLDSDRQQWATLLEETAQYCSPSRLGYISQYAPGQKKTIFLYDSIGVQCTDDLANYLSATLTPAGSDWHKVQFEDKAMRENDAANEWLQECTDIQRRHIQNSTFQATTAEINRDLIVGAACEEIGPKKDLFGNFVGLHFGFVHMREMSGMENQYGEIDLTVRHFLETTAKQWHEKFGDKAGESVVNAMEMGKPNTKIHFLHVVYPRDAKDVDEKAVQLGDAPSDKLPFASVWFNLTNRAIVEEGGYYEKPRNISRWNANTDNIYGHGPVLNAMPDIRTLNEAKRLQLVAYEKNIDPPLKSSIDDEHTEMYIGAGKNTFLENMDSLQPLYESTKWDLVMLKDNELRKSIERSFFVDLIREPLGDTGPQKTMYEVARRLERAQRILGEATGRIRNERLKWVVERSFSILYREGMFPDPPDSLAEGAALDIQYVSPLAVAQATSSLDSMRSAITDLGMIAEVMSPNDPGAWPGWDRLDPDGWITEVFEKYNIPATGTRDVEQANELRAARAEELKAQQALEATQQIAATAKDLEGAGEGQGAEFLDQLNQQTPTQQ